MITKCHTVVGGWIISRIKEETCEILYLKASKFQKSGDLSTGDYLNTPFCDHDINKKIRRAFEFRGGKISKKETKMVQLKALLETDVSWWL